MKSSVLQSNLSGLTYQRNVFAALAVLMCLALIPLSVLLLTKKERIVIVPPTLEKEFWVDGYAVSATYLEQFGVFLGQLLLGKSAQSAPSQRSVILRHTDPRYSNTMRQKLVEEEEMLKKQNASYSFFPTDILVDVDAMAIHLQGDRISYAGGKQLSTNRESYLLRFAYTGSRLLLKEIIEEKE